MGVAFFYWQLAEAEMTLGHWDDALSYLDRVLLVMETWREVDGADASCYGATALIYRDSS